MTWGLFKKVVIADRLSVIVDNVYNNPQQFNSLGLIIATVFFSFQIFCDFSGYSDIAIGAARIMGFKLMTNFNQPYNSQSIHEFWKRWHISLSSWFKDYLYIPLGGNRVTIPRWYLNLFIVFLVSGLWHGANWTFIIWGALHGFYLVFAIITKRFRERISDYFHVNKIPFLALGSTFVMVTFAWIFFRANTVQSAIYIATHIFSGLPDIFEKVLLHQPILDDFGVTKPNLMYCFMLIFFLQIVHYLQRKNMYALFKKQPTYLRWAVYYFAVIIILFLGVFENRQFIYFQF